MGSYLLSRWTLEDCIKECQKHFKSIKYTDLSNSNKKLPSFCYLRVVYLYSTTSKPRYTMWQTKKSNAPAQKRVQSDFNRFHAFGVPSSPHVILMFTSKESDSRELLRFSAQFRPGSELFIIRPTVESNMAQNLVVRSREPLLPVKTLTMVTRCLPPANVSHESFLHFDFVTKSLELISATFVDNVCGGSLCDGQSGKEPCACTKAPAKKHWAVNLAFNCNELETIANGEVSITSNELTTLFVTEDVRYWPLNDDRLNPIALHRAVSLRVLILKNYYCL